MYHVVGRATGSQSVGAVASLYCPIGTRCVVPTVKAEAATMCADRKFWGEPRPDCSKVDPNSTVIDDSNKGFFYPCDVALRTPVCGAADDDGGEEEDDGENKTMMYAIGGVLAVILVGGVGYAVMKKKKKRR